MALKIYGKPTSPYLWLATLTAAHAGVPYEFIAVPKETHRTEAYRTTQPFGQSPYIDDNGFILYESRAISRYIASKAPESGLIPTPTASLKERALFEQAASVEAANFHSHASALISAHFYNPVRGDKAAEARALLEKGLDGYERILKEQRYVAGETLTLVDLWHLPMGSMLKDGIDVEVLEDKERWPSVARWWKELIALPAWKAAKPGAQP